MRRTLTTLGIVLALMGLSIAAVADDEGEEPDDLEVEFEATGENGFVASIEAGEVTFDEDLLYIDELDFGDLEPTHGHYVAAAVYLLKSYEADDTFDPSEYRLGCLVKHYAQSDLGKEDGEDELGDITIAYEDCLKKKYVEDWEPPGQAKKDGDWTPPGQANQP